jgi:dephospho-CoA kinase
VITIGLTGGIASGKSVVSKLLAIRGARVVDVDKVAQETYKAGTAGFAALVEAFGDQIVGANGEIDRRVLGSLVFGKPDELTRLTDIVWPLTKARLEEMKKELEPTTEVLIFEAAVLIEAGWWDLVDQVWVVTAPVEIARQRLMARNGLTKEQADARIASQMTAEERAPFADVVIENSKDLPFLGGQVDKAWKALTAVAGQVKE